jgi:hypothetical protein
VAKARKAKTGLASLSEEEGSVIASLPDPRINALLEAPKKEGDGEKVLTELSRLLRSYGALVKGGPEKRALLTLMGWDEKIVLAGWHRLASICRRLEVLAHKQLRGVRFSAEEDEFLRTYGQRLAAVMLYSGNSYLTPRDDAPRAIDVFGNPEDGKHLLVGIARPRTLWVLYPVRGVDVLCRGAVLPYREFRHPERLTDAGWKALLGSAKAPKSPAWIQPVFAPERAARRRR